MRPRIAFAHNHVSGSFGCATTTHALGRDANSRRCWESSGGRICRTAVEVVASGGFGIATD
jgi:hypothetical protein